MPARNRIDLRQWRLDHSLTQQDMSWLLQVPLSTIQAWEQGKRTAPPGRVLTLALESLETYIERGGLDTQLAIGSQVMDQ